MIPSKELIEVPLFKNNILIMLTIIYLHKLKLNFINSTK